MAGQKAPAEPRQLVVDLLSEMTEEQVRLLLAYAWRLREDDLAEPALVSLLEEQTA